MEYHKTKDVIYVQQMLGPKNIQSTRIYITIESAAFKTEEDHRISKVAQTIQEGQKMVDVNFEYVCDFGNGRKLFRKRE